MFLVIQSNLTCCNPMNSSLPGSSVHGDSPVKIWGAFIQEALLTFGKSNRVCGLINISSHLTLLSFAKLKTSSPVTIVAVKIRSYVTVEIEDQVWILRRSNPRALSLFGLLNSSLEKSHL